MAKKGHFVLIPIVGLDRGKSRTRVHRVNEISLDTEIEALLLRMPWLPVSCLLPLAGAAAGAAVAGRDEKNTYVGVNSVLSMEAKIRVF